MKLDNKKFSEMLFKRYLTAQQFAKNSGIGEATIYRLTAGKSCRPSTAKKICEYLNTEPSEIFIEEDE